MAQNRPNLVFIMTDQQQARALSCYGNTVLQTPNLDKLASMGARVDEAFVSCPLCVPSRCSIMTGRYPSVTRSHNNATLLGTDEEDLTEILRTNGYRLALAGKNHCFRPDTLATWDFVYEEDHVGPRNHPDEERLAAFTQDLSEVYHRHAVSSAALPYPKEDFGTYRITEQALRFLWHASDAADPFFLLLSYPDPHPPYVIPEELDNLYHPDDVFLPEREPNDFADKPVSQWVMSHLMALDEKDDHDLRTLIARYYAAINFIDSCIGQVLDMVQSTGLAENTLIVFISDHGDFLGEHSCVEKGPALYDALIHVPLLLSWPGHIQPQLVRETMVESIDLFPTILDYLEINIPRGCQGRSLKPLLDGKSNQHKDTVYGFISLGAPVHNFGPEEAANIVARRLAEYDQNPHCRVFRWITPERNTSRGVMIRTRDWKLIHYVSGEGELYNLQDDPAEFHNLFGKPEYVEKVQALRNQLLDFLIGSFDKRPPLGFDPSLHAKGIVRP